jgi:hypothetical protein
MGSLVPFRTAQRPRSKPAEGQKEAQIIVFTGVRYVRESNEPPQGSSPSNGTKRKRG